MFSQAALNVTPRRNLKTRYLDFDLVLFHTQKNELTLHLLSMFSGANALSFGIKLFHLPPAAYVFEAIKVDLSRLRGVTKNMLPLRGVAEITIFLKIKIHGGHFSSYQIVGQYLCFEMICNKICVKMYIYVQFAKMSHEI